MSLNINKALKELTKVLAAEVTRTVTQQLRENYVADIKEIVNETLRNDEFKSNSDVESWITRNQAAAKYAVSTRTIDNHLKLFEEGIYKIDRLEMFGQNMINEKQFIESFKLKRNKPKFLIKRKAA